MEREYEDIILMQRENELKSSDSQYRHEQALEELREIQYGEDE